MNNPRKFRIDRFAREVVELGRKQAETSFPNPDRTGCPDNSVLKAMAHRSTWFAQGDLPVSHVNSCSPCFREYMAHRRTLNRTRTLRFVLASMAAGLLLAICFTLLRSYLRVDDLHGVSGEPRHSPSPVLPGPVQPEPMKVTIDLARFSATRGESPVKTPRHIALPARLIRARLLLPVGSEPGEYAIRLVSQENVAIVTTNSVAKLEEGLATLDLLMPLGPLPGTNLTLMIRPSGLRWQSYPIVVEK